MGRGLPRQCNGLLLHAAVGQLPMQAQRIPRSAGLRRALARHRQPTLGIDRAGNQLAQAIALDLEQAQGLHLQQARALLGI